MSGVGYRGGVAALAVAGALLVASLAGAPQAGAATVYACLKKKGGTIRVVSKRAKCGKGEQKISWNTEGPAGRDGAQGPQGAGGASGSPGGPGGPGPQGPGAQRLEVTQSGVVAFTPIATLGRWTLEMACENGSIAHIKFTGPGSFAYTASRGAIGGGKAETISAAEAIGAGITLSMGANTQMGLDIFLFESPSLEQVNLEFWDSAVAHNCNLVGEGIPAS